MSIKPIAPIYSVVAKSSEPKTAYFGTPAICALPNGRLIVTHDHFHARNAAVKDSCSESCFDSIMNCVVWTDIYASDDRGDTWTLKGHSPCCHATPFTAGGRVYLMGNGDGRLIIKASDDNGETWGEARCINDGEEWTDKRGLPEGYVWNRGSARAMWRGGANNAFEENGYVYFSYELRKATSHKAEEGGTWGVAANSPMLLRGKADQDLTQKENWTITPPLFFCDDVDENAFGMVGLPFYAEKRHASVRIDEKHAVSPMGPLEFNAVRIYDPNHIWYDASMRTMYLIGRFGCLRSNLAAVYKVRENEDGTMTTSHVTTPAGAEWMLLPMPGGQLKFHILYDKETKTYWLVSSQCTDSCRRPETMPETRFNMPYDQRTRLQLYFSTNCVDWCFAGIVDIGQTDIESRHYCGACIQEDDLLIVSRSGSPDAASAHNVDMVTLHKVKNFRDLIY